MDYRRAVLQAGVGSEGEGTSRTREDVNVESSSKISVGRPSGGTTTGSSKEVRTRTIAGGYTNRIRVANIPTTAGEVELRDLFSRFGVVKKHEIIRDSSGQSLGFGFIDFESEQTVENLLAIGNSIDFAGSKV